MAAIVLAVALLHLLAVQWATDRLTFPSLPESVDEVVTTTLLAPPAPTVPPTEQVAAPQPKPRPRRHSRPVAPPVPAPTPTIEPLAAPPLESSPAVEEQPTSSLAGTEAPGTSVENPVAVASPAASSSQDETQAVIINPPPSAQLHYDVQALQKGTTYYGNGKITWQTNGKTYRIDGEAGILWFSVLNFRSEGMIDEFGVSPVIYSEKRFRRPETATHFHRERNTISFSASTLSYPRQGGEQDRASLVWQLASMGRSDSAKFAPGAEINVMVAGVRDAEVWRIRILAQEEIEVGTGKLTAWHVLRLPRPGSYDQKLDIWFAPQQEWYPVRLRFTETNGDYLDMSLSKLTTGESTQ